MLCLTACSASQLLSDKEALVQLVLLVVMVFVACLIQSYVVNAVILKSFAKVNPLKFFKKTFDAQATAFTTTSSVGTMPITIDRLIRKVGVDEEVANLQRLLEQQSVWQDVHVYGRFFLQCSTLTQQDRAGE